VWLFALLWCAAREFTTAAIGITIGFAISLGSLALLERFVTALMTPEWTAQSRRAVRKLAVIALFKYAIIGLVLWASLRSGSVNPIGLVAGIALPHAVIFLKALGIMLSSGPETGHRRM
jgi:hypothetical protein